VTTNWQERPFSEEKFASLCALGLSELQARILAARGIGADGLDAFLSLSAIIPLASKRLSAPLISVMS
jgi:hypothetical protein